MKSDVVGETGAIRLGQLDLLAFVLTFLAGLLAYITLHLVLHLHQVIVSGAIIFLMLAYAVLVTHVPRLSVRLDQAGDNAYYLGLLFTLVAMAAALYEFGGAVVTASGQAPGRTGIQQIIANFGIALASTIAGIFLRVVLHQMRIDIGEVEAMTRIELAEASKKVKASIDTVTIELGLFHEAVQQRSMDMITALVEEGTKSVSSLNRELENTTKEMLVSVGNVQKGVIDQTQELTRLVGGMASEAMGAIERLREVEPPPGILWRRFDKVAKVLEAAGDQAERIADHLKGAADSAPPVMEEITKAAAELGAVAQQMKENYAEATDIIVSSAERFSVTLDSLGQWLERDRQLLTDVEEQSRRSVEEAARAQEAAIEVLTRLTELTRGLTSALKDAKADFEDV